MKAADQRTRTLGIIRLNEAKAKASKTMETSKGPLPLINSSRPSPPGILLKKEVNDDVPWPTAEAIEAADIMVSVVAPTKKKRIRKSR